MKSIRFNFLIGMGILDINNVSPFIFTGHSRQRIKGKK